MSEKKKATSAVLSDAADIVARGWCQGLFHGGDDTHCLAGALIVASGGHIGCPPPAEVAAMRYLFRCFRPGQSITEWNDALDRTQADVVAKLREAAALALAEGS